MEATFSIFFENKSKNFGFWLGGAAPVFGWGGKAPADSPIDGFSRGAAAPRTRRVFSSLLMTWVPLMTQAPTTVRRLEKLPSAAYGFNH